MHHGSSRVHEKAFGMNSAIRSWRSHCREGVQFIKSLQSCAQVHSCAPSNENTRCENSSGQRVGEALKKTGMAADESQKQKGGDRWRKERKNSAACVSNGHLSSQECGVVTPISEIHRLGRAPRWHCERRFRLSCSIHRAGFVGNTNGGRRRNGCPCKATRMCRTSSRRSISLYPSQSGGRTKIIETSKVSMPRGLDTSSTTQNGPNRGQTSKIQWFLLKEICMVTHLPDYCGKFEKGLFGTRMGEGTELRMPLRASKARSILIWDTCMTFKWLEESRSWVLCGRNWWNWLKLENRHHFLFTCTWATWVQIERNYHWWKQKNVRITNLFWSGWEITWLGKNPTRRPSLGLTTWKVMRRNAGKDIATWRIKTVEQLYKVSTPRLDDHHFKKGRIRNGGRPIKRMHSNCPDMSVFGTNWWTRPSVVDKQTGKSSHKMDKSMWQTLGSFDILQT